MDGRLPPMTTESSQQLIIDTVSLNTPSQDSPERDDRASRQYDIGLRSVRPREWGTVAVLCFVNLINYMDRFTIAGK